MLRCSIVVGQRRRERGIPLSGSGG